jgi:hypothetical protein
MTSQHFLILVVLTLAGPTGWGNGGRTSLSGITPMIYHSGSGCWSADPRSYSIPMPAIMSSIWFSSSLSNMIRHIILGQHHSILVSIARALHFTKQKLASENSLLSQTIRQSVHLYNSIHRTSFIGPRPFSMPSDRYTKETWCSQSRCQAYNRN